jgi:phage gpG-like protein
MADIGFSININTYDANKTIEGILNRLKDATPAFRTIANFMRKKVIQHFANEEGETAKWKALSPVTEALRRKGKKKNKSNKILRDTGDLIASIQSGSGKGSISEADFQHAKIGTTIYYAKYHQQPNNTGATNSYGGKGIIPKRDFMYLKTNDIDELRKILENYLTTGK